MKFLEFLKLGFGHIADRNAYDHILFIVVMCAIYHIKDWKKILILVTAFTVGHSLTLALAIFELVSIDKNLVEFLIPLTIIITAIWNMIPKNKTDFWRFENHRDLVLLDEIEEPTTQPSKKWLSSNYIMVLFFGLIHGLGFSNFLGMLLGRNESAFIPLLGFNIGVEIGQISIIGIFMLLSFLFLDILKLKQQYWIWTISIIAIIVSLELMIGA